MKYECPVCGYDALRRPPKNYHICPCCGTEFGHDDFDASHATLRREWIERGMNWFSRKTLPPANWSPVVQLLQAGYNYDMRSARPTKTAALSIVASPNGTGLTKEPVRITQRHNTPNPDRNVYGRIKLRPCLD